MIHFWRSNLTFLFLLTTCLTIIPLCEVVGQVGICEISGTSDCNSYDRKIDRTVEFRAKLLAHSFKVDATTIPLKKTVAIPYSFPLPFGGGTKSGTYDYDIDTTIAIPEKTESFAELLGTNFAFCCYCMAGTFWVPTTKTCDLCPSGYWTDVIDVDDCKACEVGKYSSGRGSTVLATCSKCPKGWYQEKEGSGECSSCDTGKYSEVKKSTASSDCQDCPFGQYGTDVGKPNVTSSCKACPLGRYGGGPGDLNLCAFCDVGKYAPTDGREVDCLDCSAGTFSLTSMPKNPSWKKCDDCPAGFHQGEKGQSFCFPWYVCCFIFHFHFHFLLN